MLVLPYRCPTIQGWTIDAELRFLYDEACRLAESGVEGGLLEVGCWLGRSTAVLAKAGRVDVVDTFEGSPEIWEVVDDQFAEFMANMEALGLSDRLRVYRGPSTVVLPLLHGPYRLIFVDGGHNYETVLSDLTESVRLLSPGGTLVVDDVVDTFPGVQHAVREVLNNEVEGVVKMGVWRK